RSPQFKRRQHVPIGVRKKWFIMEVPRKSNGREKPIPITFSKLLATRNTEVALQYVPVVKIVSPTTHPCLFSKCQGLIMRLVIFLIIQKHPAHDVFRKRTIVI